MVVLCLLMAVLAKAVCWADEMASQKAPKAVPHPFLDFETPGAIPNAVFAGAVQKTEPSPEAAHSGKGGLKLHFEGSSKRGGQYLAVPSDMAALAQGLKMWLRVRSGPGRSTLTLTFASEDYLTQWHHPVPLDFSGWKELSFWAKDFTVAHPPGIEPDWRRNYWVYWQFNGPDPVTVYLDEVEFLVDPALGSVERFVSNSRNPQGDFLFNSRLQVVCTKAAPALILRVTAFRRRLLGPASVLINGREFDQASLAASGGRVKVGEEEHRIAGSVMNLRFRVAVRLTCTPSASLTYRMPLDGETYKDQGFEVDGKHGRLASEPTGILAEASNAKQVVLGSLSKRRLTLDLGDGTDVALRLGEQGKCWLDLTSDKGALHFGMSAPSEAIEMTLSTNRFHNVYEIDERSDIAIKAAFRNNSGQSRRCSYKASMTDFDGRKVFAKPGTITVPSGFSVEQTFRPSIGRLGFYKLVLEATDAATGEDFRKFITLGVIQPVTRTKPPDKSGKFGVTFFCRTPEAARLVSKVGITWSRDSIYWAGMEPQRGDYNWSVMDTYTSNALAAGLWTMPVNGDYGAAWSHRNDTLEDKWGKTTKINLDAWSAWWSELAKRYKERVGAWEIANETYWAPVQFVVDTHRAAYRAIKAADPDVPVVANVTIGYGGTVDYLKEYLAAGGAEGCDVISAHPYCGFQASPEQGGMREAGRRVNEVIKPYFKNPRQWWTEYAWMGDDEFNPDIPGVETDWSPLIISERAMAQYVVRAYLAGMASGVERMLYFLDQDTATWQFPAGLLREEGIRPALCAINTLCRVLEFTDFVRDVNLAVDVELRVFRGANRAAAAVWSTAVPERRCVLRAALAAKDVVVLDFMGNTIKFPANARQIAVPFDGAPAYIFSEKLSPGAMAQALSRARVEGGSSLSLRRVFLKPNHLETELVNRLQQPVAAEVSVLDPKPIGWGLQATSEHVHIGARSTARLLMSRRGALPAPGLEARLRLQVAGEPAVERAYDFLPVPWASKEPNLDDDPATWGEPTIVLDDRRYTMSCAGGVQTPSTIWEGPKDLSAKLWLRWDRRALYVGIVVTDNVHLQNAGSPLDVWQHDSVQYGFDAAGNAPVRPPDGWDSTDDSEWEAALFPSGPILVRTQGPGAAPAGPVEGSLCSVRRQGEVTTYVVVFPWRVLSPATGEEGSIFGFNFIVNDDDGQGREGWMGITGGMGEGKIPRLFRKALLVR